MKKVIIKYLIVLLVHCASIFSSSHRSFAQDAKSAELSSDTVYLEKGDVLYKNDSFRIVDRDTLLFLDNGQYIIPREKFERTQKMYDSLSKIMEKSWITKEAYSFLFSDVAQSSILANRSQYTKSERPFEEYQGMTINEIYITKVDVIDGSVDDTLLIATSRLGKLANDLHVNTLDWVIRQYLLFKEGEKVQPFVMADTERIIRSLAFMEDARIRLRKIGENNVNVFVITKDLFSIGMGVRFHGFDDYDVEVYDRNFLGLGNELRMGFLYNSHHERPFGYGAAWKYNNIFGSLADASLEYQNTFNTKFFRQVISKKFLSPDIKWGGGLDIGWQSNMLYRYREDTFFLNPYANRYADLWVGRAFLFKTRDDRTNFIFASRYGKYRFLERPEVEADTNVFFHDNELFLSSLSLKKLNYFKSHKILGFGIVEDIPYGFIARALVGKSFSEFFNRTYYGFQLSGGKYFEKRGYLWADSKFGTFWRHDGVSELLLNINLVYFTPLLDVGRFENRTIIRSSYNSGVNNLDDRGLNFYGRVNGFEDKYLKGLGSYTMSMESIFFTPWFLYGFKFAPYVFFDIGVVSDKGFRIVDGAAYTSFGAGIRIRNESLVLNTISLRISYVPNQVGPERHMIFNGSAGRSFLFVDGFDDKPTFNMFNVY